MEKAISESLFTASYNMKCGNINEMIKLWKKYSHKQCLVLVLTQYQTDLL